MSLIIIRSASGIRSPHCQICISREWVKTHDQRSFGVTLLYYSSTFFNIMDVPNNVFFCNSAAFNETSSFPIDLSNFFVMLPKHQQSKVQLSHFSILPILSVPLFKPWYFCTSSFFLITYPTIIWQNSVNFYSQQFYRGSLPQWNYHIEYSYPSVSLPCPFLLHCQLIPLVCSF